MQQLAQNYLTSNEFPIFNILTLPQSDFSQLMEELQLILVELVPLEIAGEGEVLSLNGLNPFKGDANE